MGAPGGDTKSVRLARESGAVQANQSVDGWGKGPAGADRVRVGGEGAGPGGEGPTG